MDAEDVDCLASLRNKNREEVRQCLVLDQELLNRGLSILGHYIIPQAYNSSHILVEKQKQDQGRCRRTVQLGTCAKPLSTTWVVGSKTGSRLEYNMRVGNVDFSAMEQFYNLGLRGGDGY